jgi:hypothetical protein
VPRSQIPFLHVLQPNQYHSRKAFSDEERSFAISQTSPYREAVEAVYPELVDRMVRMRRSGWTAFDATVIFDNRTETVFSGNCCHYNRLGNSILEDIHPERNLGELGLGMISVSRTRWVFCTRRSLSTWALKSILASTR